MFDPDSISFLNSDSKLRVIKAFLDQLDELKMEIAQASKKQDWEKVKRIAHKMKGSGLTLKAEELAEASSMIESQISDVNSDERKSMIETLYEAMTHTKEYVLEYQNDLKQKR